MSDRPRILVLEGPDHQAGDFVQRCQPDCELVRVHDAARGLALLQSEHFDGIYADTANAAALARGEQLLQAERILDALSDGVAVVTPDVRVTWANPTFERWCGGQAVGRSFSEALESSANRGPGISPFQTALAGKSVTTRLHGRDNRDLELHITPVSAGPGANRITHLIALCRDVTAETQQQLKLDALHQAGSALAALGAEQLADLSMEERVELLKQNIRRLTHDLLHYDVIKITLLDPHSGRLEPLVHEGMKPAAAERILYARAEGNGITGYVAATGKSYLCPDTAADPRYLEGAEGARSSLTVPLIVQDKVIGTFNVESPRLNAFGEEDLKFAETFCREVAAALHTLQLLTAEKRSAASQSVEAISRAVALPVDDILAATTAVLDRYIGHEPELADKLRQILAGARSIKQLIQKLGEDMGASSAPLRPGADTHPGLKGLRILVADNDERVRRSAHGLLGRFGCVVETARDGQEALTMARLSTYDVILVDIRLPDVSGYEMFKRLHDAQPQARVILMSAYGYDAGHSIVKCRQEGLRSVLFKPFRVDQLLEALEKPLQAKDEMSKGNA